MACAVIGGPVTLSAEEDDNGHRTYKVRFKVKGLLTDGPAAALRAAGLPAPGSLWQIKVRGPASPADTDVYAWFCRKKSVSGVQEKEGEPNRFWYIDMEASTKAESRCCDESFDDPLMEPQKVSGGYSKFQEEATHDRFLMPILTSSHEQLRGPQVEFDKSRATVRVEQNVLNLEIELFDPMIDTVNDATLWGAPRRCVKLSNVSWEKNYHTSCEVYYKRTLEFEVFIRRDPFTNEMKSGFDRDLLDEGTKALHGELVEGKWKITPVSYYGEEWGDPDYRFPIWPDRTNPLHFIRFADKKGNVARVVLDGCGEPWDPDKYARVSWWYVNDPLDPYTFQGTCADARYAAGGNPLYGPFDTEEAAGIEGSVVDCCAEKEPGKVHVEKYQESNFLLLGIPTVL